MNAHNVRIDVEDFAADLCERRLWALSERRNTRIDVDATRPIRPQRDAFMRTETRLAFGEELRTGIARSLNE